LETENENSKKPADRVSRSWYPVAIILLCVHLIIKAASPLRTAANSLEITFEFLPELKDYKAPSCTTIKRWLQKVGYYKLTQPKAISNDWMILIDASIQMGEKKCVLVLGRRLRDFPKNRPLTLEDLEILGLRVVSTMNANLITQILHEAAQSIGKIISICSDRGSEMVRGIKDFQVYKPEVRHISDTAHRVSNLLEATLEKSERWKNFREQVTHARRKMQNSLVPGALPPSPRTKARYMNVDSLIEWALQMLILLDKGTSTPDFNVAELKKYCQWLFDYQDDIYYWNRLVSIGAAARQCVRVEGIHMNIVDSFEEAISAIQMGCREMSFANQLSLFLTEQSKGMMAGEFYIGSTEVLESFFGKIKYMEQEQTAFGFTSLVLAALACIGPIDVRTITEAITSVRQSNINKWEAKEIGKSVQSQRKKLKKMIADLTIKTGRKVSGTLERVMAGL